MKRNVIWNFDDLLNVARSLPAKTIAVIYPRSEETYNSIRDASKSLKAKFILYCDESSSSGAAGLVNKEEIQAEIVIVHDAVEAVTKAVEKAGSNRYDILMKGDVDTGTMMRVVLQESSSLRTGKLLSDIFVLEYQSRTDNKFVMITDGGMTLAPDLKNKVELIDNAVEVAHALGNELPKVAILSATEFVLPNLQSTLDAAALSKMNERGQIKGCVVDGPLALDNALSPEAAAEKSINSAVAGRAEILVAANIESANSLAKSTTYFAGLRLAHVIVGARLPILIPSRSDKSDAKLLSIALGIVMSEHFQFH
ncbi:MAG TPA: phosphate acyltransferase [Candidatus Kryptonia bacterium]